MTELVDRTLGERIKVVIEGLDQGSAIWADPHQFENAIVNLAVNARDAMESDGTLTIRIERKSLQDREVNSLSAGDYIAVAVSDTGCGMTAEEIDRAFEPFFTTKPVGKGTGLGLSQVFGFARQSGGDVTIASRLGEGTTVTLYIPRLPAADVATTEAPQPISLIAPVPLQPKVSAATILIVEDDPRVRIATVGALEELGHQTIACGSGEEALGELQQRHNIDLLITDVIMPSMTGPELVSQVVKLYPHVGVLFVTGFAGGAGGVDSFAEHDVLRKPFTVAGLSTAVEAALQKVTGRRHGPTSAAAE
jgi:CheY-like chemotaxis protein